MTRFARLLAMLPAAALLSCAAGDPPPAALDTRNDACRFCRMPVSDARLAAQIAAPGEEPRFFDDIGCLRDSLKQGARPPSGAVSYVADHRTGAWVRAGAAVYSRCPSLETPMGSHLMAHADPASRGADPAARGCAPVSAGEIFGHDGPPDGTRKGG